MQYVNLNLVIYVCDKHNVLVVDNWRACNYEQAMNPPPVYAIIGESIRTRRRQLKWTQERLAKQLGISRASLANIETGRQQILAHQIYNFAEQLELDITDLLPPPNSISVVDNDSDVPLPKGLKPRDRHLAARIFREADTRDQGEGAEHGGSESGRTRATGSGRTRLR